MILSELGIRSVFIGLKLHILLLSTLIPKACKLAISSFSPEALIAKMGSWAFNFGNKFFQSFNTLWALVAVRLQRHQRCRLGPVINALGMQLVAMSAEAIYHQSCQMCGFVMNQRIRLRVYSPWHIVAKTPLDLFDPWARWERGATKNLRAPAPLRRLTEPRSSSEDAALSNCVQLL